MTKRCSIKPAVRSCGGKSITASSAACRGAFPSRATTPIDVQSNYQYRAFGVPGLGLKRGLAEDLVIAPYATAMALMVAPEAACKNLERMFDEGMSGAYGFYEAIDFTPSRLLPQRVPCGRSPIHGPSPGHEPAFAGVFPARSSDAAALRCRPHAARRRSAASRARAAGEQSRFPAYHRSRCLSRLVARTTGNRCA